MAGTFTVTVTATDSHGASTSAAQVVNVTPPVKPEFLAFLGRTATFTKRDPNDPNKFATFQLANFGTVWAQITVTAGLNDTVADFQVTYTDPANPVSRYLDQHGQFDLTNGQFTGNWQKVTINLGGGEAIYQNLSGSCGVGYTVGSNGNVAAFTISNFSVLVNGVNYTAPTFINDQSAYQ